MSRLKKSQVSLPKLSLIKNCKAKRETIVFSFAYLTENKDFGFGGCKSTEEFVALSNALRLISKQTWDEFANRGKDKGIEILSLSELKPAIRNILKEQCDNGEKVCISRFNGKKGRIFYRRGSKCNRVAHILAIEWTLGDAYKHGH